MTTEPKKPEEAKLPTAAPKVASKVKTKKVKPRTKSGTASQWAEAEAIWANGDATAEELGKRLGKSVDTIRRHMVDKKIKKGQAKEEQAEAIRKALAAQQVAAATVVTTRIAETKEDHYKMSAAMAKLAWAEILTAREGKLPLASVEKNLKAIEAAMKILTMARSERYAVLGLNDKDGDDPNDIPELVISELTDERALQLQNRKFDIGGENDFDAEAARLFDEDETAVPSAVPPA